MPTKNPATEHGRRVEAELRAILDEAVGPKHPGRGAPLAAISRDLDGLELDITRD